MSTAQSTSRLLKTWPTATGQSASASSCHVQTSAHHLDRVSNKDHFPGSRACSNQARTQTKQKLTQTEQELLQKVISLSQDLTRVTQELIVSQSQELTRTKQEIAKKVATQSQELTRTKRELIHMATSQDQALEAKLKEVQRQATERLQIQQQRDLQEITEIRQELTQKVAFQSQELIRTHQELMQRVTLQSQELSRVKAELNETQRQAIDRLQAQQQSDLRQLKTGVEMRRDIIPVTIKMAAFDMLKKKRTGWFSHPFYTGRGGYKMCLSVDANGDGTGKGTHVSVFTCLMRGEFDSHLKWPFRGTVTIQLVNQLEDKEHHTETYDYTDTTRRGCTARVTDGGRSLDVFGKHKFILHSELGLSVANNCKYLKDDCLIFHVDIVSVNLN